MQVALLDILFPRVDTSTLARRRPSFLHAYMAATALPLLDAATDSAAAILTAPPPDFTAEEDAGVEAVPSSLVDAAALGGGGGLGALGGAAEIPSGFVARPQPARHFGEPAPFLPT